MDGFEYCGNHSYCYNSDDDSRGLTCYCDSGYTSHRIFFGETNMGKSESRFCSILTIRMSGS